MAEYCLLTLSLSLIIIEVLRKKGEKTLQELNLAHRHSQAKCQLIQTVTLNE